ncbi:hypothetical protein LVJ94_16780 [Pendulispora rubella]|uniref:Uncharacterized protein n=1 Tax=Pendulispora rubella TaxID=2741070 RepID=A0ABZ2LGG7_9BACT
MRTLTRMEMRWAYAVFGAIFPSGASERLPLGICDLDLETYLTQIRSRAPYRSALGLRVAIWVIALAPMFVLYRACTIMSLDTASRETLLKKMLASPVYVVRQLVMLLKAVGAVLYAGTPSVNQAILATSHPELNQSGTRLIGIGRKPGSEHDEHDDHEDQEADEDQHDEQSVA